MTLSNKQRSPAGFFKSRNALSRGHRQRGLTMVELLVALVLSLLIALAGIAALTVTRQGFRTVDAASQLRDNSRFVSDLIQRIGVQTGFEDVLYTATPPTPAELAANFAPNVSGFNNALVSATDPLNSKTDRTAGVVGYGSDVLILRFQTVQLNVNATASDQSMIDCNGNAPATAATTRDERSASILSVAVSNGEPSLMCTTVDPAGTISAPQPIIQGVENFQVLYGVDATTFTPNTVFTPTPVTSTSYSVPKGFLRADQMTVPADPVGTNANWRLVRSLRIGMILRGPPNSNQDPTGKRFYPLGLAKSSSTATAGSALSSTNDVGTVFDAPADGRLRQVVNFTLHLRNVQCNVSATTGTCL